MTDTLHDLGDWEETRDALQAYAKVLGAIRRETNDPHPRWWHVSLLPAGHGATTGPLGRGKPDGREIAIDLDLVDHAIRLRQGEEEVLALRIGSSSPTRVGETLLTTLPRFGLAPAPDPERWQDDETPRYDEGAASRYRDTLAKVAAVFVQVRESFEGETSPIQLWPHHFDLSFEWFGGRTVEQEEDGERRASPTQIGFGFSTGDEGHAGAYFYANPWEFDSDLTFHALPGHAEWHTERWQGSILPLAEVGNAASLATYLRRVYDLAAPGLR